MKMVNLIHWCLKMHRLNITQCVFDHV